MRPARILSRMVSAQGFSKGQTWYVAGDFVRDKDQRTGRVTWTIEKAIVFNWNWQKLKTHMG